MIGVADLPPIRDEVRRLALNFAPRECRQGLHALWALDEALGQIVRTTTEPMIGQMRLTWWHDRLSGLDQGERAAEPVLVALAAALPSCGRALAAMVEAWEALLDPLPWDDSVIDAHARIRGAGLFALSADLLGGRSAVAAAGSGWAAADLARHCSDAGTAARAQAAAREFLDVGAAVPVKPLRILTRIAWRDALQPAGAPRSRFDVLRACWF